MGKFWAGLFGMTMLACFALFVVAPFVGWWLPEGVSEHSGGVDGLFYFILIITGIFFVLTEGLLVYFMFCFSAKKPIGEVDAHKPPNPELAQKMVKPFKKYIRSEHSLEIAWTIIPAILLLVIAVVQIPAWVGAKFPSYQPGQEKGTPPFQIAVSARQFEWRMRYPHPDTWQSWKETWQKEPHKAKRIVRRWSKYPYIDDVHIPNELHVWTNENKSEDERFPAFVIRLSTLDVQHNFNLPNFRVKQDALPGKIIPVWFRPTKANTLFSHDDDDWKDGYRVVHKHTEHKKDLKTLVKELGLETKAEGNDKQTKLIAKGLESKGPQREQLKSLIENALAKTQRHVTWDGEKANIYIWKGGKDAKGVWEIACAELCGRWHFHMIGRVYVHPSEEDFLGWLRRAAAQSAQTTR